MKRKRSVRDQKEFLVVDEGRREEGKAKGMILLEITSPEIIWVAPAVQCHFGDRNFVGPTNDKGI